MNIYVIVKETGDYSDTRIENILAFSQEKDADEFLEAIKLYKEHLLKFKDIVTDYVKNYETAPTFPMYVQKPDAIEVFDKMNALGLLVEEQITKLALVKQEYEEKLKKYNEEASSFISRRDAFITKKNKDLENFVKENIKIPEELTKYQQYIEANLTSLLTDLPRFYIDTVELI